MLDEFTGTYFVGAPDVTTLPLAMFTASLAGKLSDRRDHGADAAGPFGRLHAADRGFLKAEMLAMVGSALVPESRLRYDKLTITVS